MRSLPLLVASLLSLAVGCGPTAEPAYPESVVSEPPSEAHPAGESRLRTVYVPAYSHLQPTGKGSKQSMLSILLSVRNIDTQATVTLTHVDFFDTAGTRVRRYLPSPRELRPLETAEFVVDTWDPTGGSGANFLVFWEGPSDAHPLLTEAVMSGQMGPGWVAFTSRGVELDRRPTSNATPTPATPEQPADQEQPPTPATPEQPATPEPPEAPAPPDASGAP